MEQLQTRSEVRHTFNEWIQSLHKASGSNKQEYGSSSGGKSLHLNPIFMVDQKYDSSLVKY